VLILLIISRQAQASGRFNGALGPAPRDHGLSLISVLCGPISPSFRPTLSTYHGITKYVPLALALLCSSWLKLVTTSLSLAIYCLIHEPGPQVMYAPPLEVCQGSGTRYSKEMMVASCAENKEYLGKGPFRAWVASASCREH
jgi:hypothetical protein